MSNCLEQIGSDEREHLITAFHTKQAFFWIGSGFSRNFGYTSWSGILQNLADKFKFEGELPENPLRSAELLCAIASRAGIDNDGFCEEVCTLLKESRVSNVKPAWTADFSRLASDVIVTTNWDDVLERDIFDGYANVVIRRVSPSQLDRSGRNILKIHGDMKYPQSLVFTHSQYNTFQREDNYLSRKVYTLFAEMTPIFLGYSLSDPNIFFLFDEAFVDGNSQNRAYMVIPEETPEEQYAEYSLVLAQKGITIIRADIGSFLSAIDEGVAAIKGTIADFNSRYKGVLPRITMIISAAKEGRKKWEVLAEEFNLPETGKVVIDAMTEFLSSPDLYQSLGGTLSSFDQRIPKYANHILSQVGIAIAKKLKINLPDAFRFVVIDNAIQGLRGRDFNSSGEPFIDLLSHHIPKGSSVFEKKIQSIVSILDWSAPPYNRGYCWATWEAFFSNISWIRDYEQEAIIDEVERRVKEQGDLPDDTVRWLKEFEGHLTGDLKARVENLIIPF